MFLPPWAFVQAASGLSSLLGLTVNQAGGAFKTNALPTSRAKLPAFRQL
jgi:hypothetical protein